MRPVRQSIRSKVTWVVVLLTCTSILLAAVGFFFLQRSTFQRLSESQLSAIADVVGGSVNAALLVIPPSPEDAERSLERLCANSEVDQAHIFELGTMALFASAPSTATPPESVIQQLQAAAQMSSAGPQQKSYQPSPTGLWLVQRLRDDRGNPIAYAALHSTAASLRADERKFGLLFAGVTLSMLILAYLAALQLHRSLSSPVLSLAETVGKIEATGDHTLRVNLTGQDEIGRLGEGINHMLDALDERSAALRASDQWNRTLFSVTPTPIVVLDLVTGRFNDVNEPACDLFGLSRQQLLERGPVQLSPPRQPDGRASDRAAEELIGQALQGGITRFEWSHLKASGQTVPCEVTLTMIPVKGRQLVCGVLVDLTERKRAEEERLKQLRLAEQRQRTILRLASEPALMSGDLERAAGIITEVAAEVFAVDRVSIWLMNPDGRSLRCVDLFDFRQGRHTQRELLTEVAYPQYFAALRQGRAIDAHDAQTDPRTREFLEEYLLPNDICSLLDGTIRVGGKVVGVVCHEQTGSRRVWTSDEIAFAGEIADQVANILLNQERATLEEQLRQAQKLESLGTLAGGIAHDFNNILAAIIGNLEVSRLDVPADHPLQESLQEIGKAAHRARELVRQILAFSRRQDQALRQLQLGPVVLEATQLLRSTLPANVELREQVADDLPLVMADASQVHQLVMNLITNSWHAMEDQPGVIDVVVETVQVDSRLSQTSSDLRPGRYVRLVVRDTGKGIPPAVKERMFDPFFTTKAQGKGTGLGLSTVHGIMRSCAGAITVESEAGQGATFNLYFPAVTTPAAPERKLDMIKETPTGSGQHILFLDDEEPLVYLATRMLERLGYRVTGHTNPKEALAAFEQAPEAFDLVVTDFSMPGSSGLDVARHMLRLRPDVKIVMASGYVRDEEVARARALGVLEVVLKPNSIEHLGNVIHQLLARAQTATGNPPASTG